MSKIQRNDTLFNSTSAECMKLLSGDTDANISVIFVFLLINFVVGLPANVWMVWIICHGTTELLTSEIHHLSLAVCEIVYCLGLPAELYCMYDFEHMRIPRPHDGLYILLTLQMALLWTGRPIFQCCICVERYIAVVHPLIFIR